MSDQIVMNVFLTVLGLILGWLQRGGYPSSQIALEYIQIFLGRIERLVMNQKVALSYGLLFAGLTEGLRCPP